MSKTDRELLELAAKAARLERPQPAMGCGIVYAGGKYWNPLTDDGDALRLAVKLRINLQHLTTMGGRAEGMNCWPVGRGDAGADEPYGEDPCAATRRAIVRAAAAIGEAKP